MVRRNEHELLDEFKLRMAQATLQCADLPTIRVKSLSNLQRWKENGTWGPVYDEWWKLMAASSDADVIAAMTNPDEEANRLRQSPPYVGIVGRDVRERVAYSIERDLSLRQTGEILFLDTEFTGIDQDKPDLISIGLVDKAGREFYAELPPSHYAVQCNEWVHFNVLPHLWGGDYVQSVAAIRDRLTAWLVGIEDRAVIVTDCPDADFRFLRWLLPEWPKKLAPAPLLFTAWSMGDEEQPQLHARMANYYTPERPAHHALHDANSLRIGMLYALEHGWRT